MLLPLKPLVLSILLLITCLVNTHVQAQDNALKANIVSPFLKTGSVFYERAFGSTSLQLGFYYANTDIDRLEYTGFGITPEFRFYFSGKSALSGFYTAPFLRIQHLNISAETGWRPIDGGNLIIPLNSEEKLTTFGGGIIIGKQFIIKNHLVIDAFVGPQYNSGFEKIYGENGKTDFEKGSLLGLGLRAGLCVGWAF